MRDRKHHNNKGYRQIKNGKTREWASKMNKKLHKIKVKVIRDDTIGGGFAAYLMPSLTKDGEAKVLLNIEATFHAAVENDLNVKEFIIENVMHEIGHALEEYFGVEFSEDRMEKVIDKYRERYCKNIEGVG